MVSRATSLDTAIFWDIENMSSAERLSMRRLSEAVLKRGQDEGFVEGVALNRAYADWSKSEFMPLRREMVEAGVDPRQTLRFDETSKGKPVVENSG
jgi:hypothetical protein